MNAENEPKMRIMRWQTNRGELWGKDDHSHIIDLSVKLPVCAPVVSLSVMYITNAIIIQRTALWGVGDGCVCQYIGRSVCGSAQRLGAGSSGTKSRMTSCMYSQKTISLVFLRMIKKIEAWEIARIVRWHGLEHNKTEREIWNLSGVCIYICRKIQVLKCVCCNLHWVSWSTSRQNLDHKYKNSRQRYPSLTHPSPSLPPPSNQSPPWSNLISLDLEQLWPDLTSKLKDTLPLALLLIPLRHQVCGTNFRGGYLPKGHRRRRCSGARERGS